jgi:hypothetical protein
LVQRDFTKIADSIGAGTKKRKKETCAAADPILLIHLKFHESVVIKKVPVNRDLYAFVSDALICCCSF